jgi:bifunctional DNA-binding transcriptional regulator/antitoxin component of YhaV-PrlF toxin-antitoxin module
VHPQSSAEELVVVDSAGRLQLPSSQRALAGIGRRAKVEIVDGGLLIRPGDEGTAEPFGEDPDVDLAGLYD